MSQFAIRVSDLGKMYYIGARRENIDKDLRDMLAESLTAPIRRTRKLLSGRVESAAELEEQFWALQDITFDIEPGEVVGIIGHNGAGKSTLLKILSRITEPTTGRVELRGRVSSLLEVGTGFHPELTGQENIYLNGSILGMRRAEIDRRFDEIVDFAGVEKFIDTPVKHYSSGMYLRLAFAVAAHLEPEILLIDEVLAVGDAAFQRKCLGKMESVAREGRTVIFVSHNMGAVSALTQRSFCLQDGRIIDEGETEQVIQNYLLRLTQSIDNDGKVDLAAAPRVFGSREAAHLDWLRTINSNGQQSNIFLEGEPIKIEVGFTIKRPTSGLEFFFDVRTVDGGTSLFRSPSGQYQEVLEPGKYTCSAIMDPNYLRAKDYSLGIVMIIRGYREDLVNPALHFIVEKHLKEGDNPFYADPLFAKSYFRFDYKWGDIALALDHDLESVQDNV